MSSIKIASNVNLPLKYLNRHMLVAGATGSGKTVTLMRIAEQCRLKEIPVLITDMKGDVSTLAALDAPLAPRLDASIVYTHPNVPTRVQIPLRYFSPEEIARLIGASPLQADALQEVWPLVEYDFESLAVLLSDIVTGKRVSRYMHKSTASALLRRVAPMIHKFPFVGAKNQYAPNANTGLTILEATDLSNDTRAYGVFMARLLTDRFRRLSEVGDAAAPRLVLIIDEAHLLFEGMTPESLRAFESIVRLIRSKGVALVFASQNPTDIPKVILSQLGTRIIHALRPGESATAGLAATLPAFAPKQPVTAEDIYNLYSGEAVVSYIDAKGRMTPSQTIQIMLPQTPLGHLQPLPTYFEAEVAEKEAEPVADEVRPVGAGKSAAAFFVIFGSAFVSTLVGAAGMWVITKPLPLEYRDLNGWRTLLSLGGAAAGLYGWGQGFTILRWVYNKTNPKKGL